MSSRTPMSPGKILLFTLAPIVIFAILVEAGSWVILKAFDAKVHARYNRVVSGYSVFTTTRDFSFLTSKTDPSQVDVTTDAYGFVHDSPIEIDKPENTIRIFLNGGSALFGAGQAVVYSPARKFPSQLYSYPNSIAGQLENLLLSARTDLDFEVINAAAYTKRIHQSATDYLSNISRFAPDFIINMDGYNDLNLFLSGTPFVDLEKDLQLYIDLEAPPRFPQTLNSYQFAKRVIGRLFVNPFATGLGARIEATDPAEAIPRAEYLEHKPRYVANSERLLDTIDRYSAMLQRDRVEWLFVLQPMVDRGLNKELTTSETDWQGYVQTFKNEHPEYREVLRYFFDDYLSDAIRERVELAGYSYLDMGWESRVLNDGFQLFTDYCHLTIEGNAFVAERMAEFVLGALDSNGAATLRKSRTH